MCPSCVSYHCLFNYLRDYANNADLHVGITDSKGMLLKHFPISIFRLGLNREFGIFIQNNFTQPSMHALKSMFFLSFTGRTINT